MTEYVPKSFAFVLGREIELAKIELESVLNRLCFCFSVSSVSGNVAFINIENAENFDPMVVINQLGGTIKIFEIIGPRSENIAGQLFELIFSQKAGTSKKFNFGISSFDRNLGKGTINRIGLDAKKMLEGTLKSRFVAVRDSNELSSIVSLKNHLVGEGIEIAIFKNNLGVLVALSDPEEWGKRDYDKPAGDKKSGMVPPKLARMMVNIALGLQIPSNKFQVTNKFKLPITQTDSGLNFENSNLDVVCNLELSACDFHGCVVADPFCGSGNILLEAMLLGCDVIGSDVSEKAVSDTLANIAWLIENYELRISNEGRAPFKIFEADATKDNFFEILSTFNFQLSTLCVVTEPYLGEPKKFAPSMRSAVGEYSKIKENYLAFLKNLRTLTLSHSASSADRRRGGLTLSIVFPLVETSENERYSLYGISVDEIKKLGYTELRTPLIYGRDYQIVKREIGFLGLK